MRARVASIAKNSSEVIDMVEGVLEILMELMDRYLCMYVCLYVYVAVVHITRLRFGMYV
jgi:hypothetical protein